MQHIADRHALRLGGGTGGRFAEMLARLPPDLREEGALGGFLGPKVLVGLGAGEEVQALPGASGGDVEEAAGLDVVGFAVELADGKGLIVPVVKHTEGLNLLGMARAVAEIAQRARDKKLTPDDVQGGTFTITNPGGYGTFHGTPVISQPQAAILGTYAVVKRPWVVQDELGQDVIAIRPMMNLTLTYDHRLVDGALAGRFLRDLRVKLESWGESDY